MSHRGRGDARAEQRGDMAGRVGISAAIACHRGASLFFGGGRYHPVENHRSEESGQGRARTGDTGLFRAVLYQLSYLTSWFIRICEDRRV